MEIIIFILLCLITLFLWFIQKRLNEYIQEQNLLDFPLYSAREIYVKRVMCEYLEKEAEKLYDHKPDYFLACKESGKEREELRAMLEGNYAIRSGRKTFGQVAKENLNKLMDSKEGQAVNKTLKNLINFEESKK